MMFYSNITITFLSYTDIVNMVLFLWKSNLKIMFLYRMYVGQGPFSSAEFW